MRLLLVLVLCAISVPALACEGFQNAMSALEHSMGIENPQTRAPQNSRAVDFQGRTLSFITRSAVDGSGASKIGIYQYKGGAWVLIKSVTAPVSSGITYKQAADNITFYPAGGRYALLTLTARDLI